MAFGFKNNKEKASIRTVTLTDSTTSTSSRYSDFNFPIDDDEIVLALMCKTSASAGKWYYMSKIDEGDYSQPVEIVYAQHSPLLDTFYVSCHVDGSPSADNDVTIKAVLMKID